MNQVTLRVVESVAIVLVTQQDLDVVLGKRAVVVHDLVESIAEGPGVGLAQPASLVGCIAVVLVVGESTLVIIEICSEIGGQSQSVEKSVFICRT